MAIERADRKVLTERWGSTGLLKGITSDFEKEQMAVLLQNQLLDNEQFGEQRNECGDSNARGKYSQFMRLSIPITRRVYNSNALLAFKIASVQAIQHLEDNFYYRDGYGNLKPRSVAARTRKLKERPMTTEELRGKFEENGYPLDAKFEEQGDPAYNLDVEAQITAEVCQRIANEINNEVVGDIKTNAGIKHVHTWKSVDDLKACVGFVASQIFRKSTKQANWIVTSAEMATELMGEKQEIDGELPKYVGKLTERYNVYTHWKMNPNELMMGHKGDDYTAGYFYCPLTPIFWNPSNVEIDGHWDYNYMARYGKAMPFPDFYGNVTVTGYSEKEKK